MNVHRAKMKFVHFELDVAFSSEYSDVKQVREASTGNVGSEISAFQWTEKEETE